MYTQGNNCYIHPSPSLNEHLMQQSPYGNMRNVAMENDPKSKMDDLETQINPQSNKDRI